MFPTLCFNDIVIADNQSHRAVWSRCGRHADQTRQEDYRWVCHFSLLLLLLLLGVSSQPSLSPATDEQFVLKRIADSAIDIYAMVVVLSRCRDLVLASAFLSVLLSKTKTWLLTVLLPLCAELPARWVRARLQRSTRRCCVRPGARRWAPVAMDSLTSSSPTFFHLWSIIVHWLLIKQCSWRII